jgi:hypothetical protein
MTIGSKRITRETAYGEKLIFFSKNVEEAVLLQEKLLAQGFVWGDGTKTVGSADDCSKYGLILDDGIMWVGVAKSSTRREVCRVDQIGEGAGSAPVPRDSVLEMFERVAARLDAMERRLEGIEAQLTPAPVLDKSRLKGPGPKPGETS